MEFMHSRLRTVRPVLPWLAFLILFVFSHQPLQAQQTHVTGKVLSSKDQTPLAGVSIRASGTARGTTSNRDGSFTISTPAAATLYFSMQGYLPKEMAVGDGNLGAILLDQDLKSLDSVVVVGYGTQKKVNLTGAVATVDMSEKEGQPITNVSNALHGVPGLFVNLGNSQPGVDRSTIRIRGIGTLNDNDPLVLVDGIEYSMDELNPEDIASISVLKDASAAIYGSRAANGVILVTTKTGKGKSHVNYGYYNGIQQSTFLPDAIWDPIAYMKLKDQAELNEGKQAVDYSDADIAEYQAGLKSDPFTYPSSNWFDIALKNGRIQKHDLSVSGSGDKYQYRFSLGYLDRDGIMIGPNNHEKKYSLGVNTSVNISKRLKIGFTLDGYYRQYTQPFYNSFWSYLSRTLPILTDTLPDGRYGNSWLRTPGRNNWENPRMIAYTGYGKKTVQRFVSSLYADYKLPFDITYQIKFGVDKYDGLLEEFTPQVQTFNPKTLDPINWNSPATAPRAQNTDYGDLNIHFYNTLNWQHSFAAAHHVALMLGSSYDRFSSGSFAAAMTGYLDATLTALDAGTVRYATSGNSTADVLESYFGRLNYDFNGKYLLEATFREDGSSRFAPGNRWGFFPSVSAGWRIDKENFFTWNNLFSLVKLRASVGQMGNQAVPLYSYENSIVLGQNYSFGKTLVSGAAATAYSDPNITWETTTSYNAGLDLELLKGSLSFTADVYKKRTTGILRAVSIPAQIGGLTGPQENIGTMDNTGVELTAKYNNHIGAFGYGVSGSFSYNRNRVVDIDGQILYNYQSNISTITQAGYPIDSYYLLDAVGIFQSDAEVANSAFQSTSTKAGYLKYRDVNKDGIINGDDRIAISSSTVIPKYTYGFGLNFSYKGIALDAFFQGVAGIKIYPTANLAFPFNNGANATWEWAHDSWTPDHTDARLPIVTESTGNTDNFQSSTFWMRDGSYLRMKDIQLSYQLPDKWLSRVKINRLAVFVNAENWVTFSKYKDFDPESIVNANSLYHYPMLKTLTGGVKVTF
jgi:TonB-linked SusC/RagA family outer membrane protein